MKKHGVRTSSDDSVKVRSRPRISWIIKEHNTRHSTSSTEDQNKKINGRTSEHDSERAASSKVPVKFSTTSSQLTKSTSYAG